MLNMNAHIRKKLKGKKYIGSGGTRVVYDLGNGRVLKIAKSGTGVRCNRMEVKMYKSSLKPVKQYLAKIIDYDEAYHWIIMKKYERRFPDTPEYRRKLKKIVMIFRMNGIIPSEGVARYDAPYGPNLRLKRNNQIVVIDYGGFEYGSLPRH